MGPGPGSTADASFIGSVYPAFYRSRLSRTLLRTRIGRCPNRPGLTRVQNFRAPRTPMLAAVHVDDRSCGPVPMTTGDSARGYTDARRLLSARTANTR